ncbi:MAG: hypothetical protein AMXMBFR81_10030 [Chthonomonas sp.]
MNPLPEHSADLAELCEPVRASRAAFDRVIATVRPDLWRFCYGLTGSVWDAEDLVQDTLARTFARLSHIWQSVPARALLFRVATNIWIDQQRRRKDHEVPISEIEVAAEPELAAVEVLPALERLVTLLPPLQRVVIMLTQGFEFTAAEAAAMLNMTEGAVRSALHRARTTLMNVREVDEEKAPERELDDSQRQVVETFLTAFQKKDPDLVASSLSREVHVEIVGVADEYGRETARRSCLAEWSREWTSQTAQLVQVDGKQVVAILDEAIGGRRVVDALRLEPAGSSVGKLRIYFFCPEVLDHIARALGTSYAHHGYTYPGGAA